MCEDILAPRDQYIHSECRKKLEFIKEPYCFRCGKPLDSQEKEYCYDCMHKNFHYIRGFPCIKYDKRMSHSIASFKYKAKKEYADYYVDEMLKRYSVVWRKIQFDQIMPVPIHKSKLRERGYNQAELIADGIGKAIQVPMNTKALKRYKKTLPQKELNDKERLKNLEEAFTIDREYLDSSCRRVLLVDDIYTTGSTIEACAKLLNSFGVEEVYYSAVCIGRGY